jgi:predicted oxidoreductase (fatty acid repression mutant protein)
MSKEEPEKQNLRSTKKMDKEVFAEAETVMYYLATNDVELLRHNYLLYCWNYQKWGCQHSEVLGEETTQVIQEVYERWRTQKICFPETVKDTLVR